MHDCRQCASLMVQLADLRMRRGLCMSVKIRIMRWAGLHGESQSAFHQYQAEKTSRSVHKVHGWLERAHITIVCPVMSALPGAGQVREGEAPSYFNAVEAAVLVELVEGLLASTQQSGVRGVRPDDLGVMATYRKQVGHASNTATLVMQAQAAA